MGHAGSIVDAAGGRKRYFRLILDGIPIRDVSHRVDVSRLSSGAAKDLRVGVAAAAPAFSAFTLVVDSVEIIEERSSK